MSILRLEKPVENALTSAAKKCSKITIRKTEKKQNRYQTPQRKKLRLFYRLQKRFWLGWACMTDFYLSYYKITSVAVSFYLINSLYSTSTCPIKIGQNQTQSFPYERGVHPQSCILSPLLFSLFINNDIPVSFEETLFDPFALPNGT